MNILKIKSKMKKNKKAFEASFLVDVYAFLIFVAIVIIFLILFTVMGPKQKQISVEEQFTQGILVYPDLNTFLHTKYTINGKDMAVYQYIVFNTIDLSKLADKYSANLKQKESDFFVGSGLYSNAPHYLKGIQITRGYSGSSQNTQYLPSYHIFANPNEIIKVEMK